MPNRDLTATKTIALRLLAITFILIVIAAVVSRATAPAEAAGAGRHIGYGISVAPHVPSRPDLLNAMGMDWVQIYSTSQLGHYPGQHVLYRVDIPYADPNYDEWERGLPNLARELAAAGVDAVQIGNEPNLAFEWRGQRPNAARAADGLCRGYRAFKATAPQIIVVLSGIAPTAEGLDGVSVVDTEFTRAMFANGAKECFDAFGYHPYGFNNTPEADPNRFLWSFRRTELMYRFLWENGVRDRQMWLTEFGWMRNPAEDGLDCSKDPQFVDFQWMIVPKETQASYTARAFKFADSNWPYVGPMFYWNLNWNLSTDPGLSKCNHMRRFAIVDDSGEPLAAPSVFHTLQTLEKRPPVEYRPTVGAILNGGLSKTLEAGCTGQLKLGSFTVRNSGYPGHLEVTIKAANGPGLPPVWVSTETAESGTEVEVFVDSTGLGPGLHVVAINLRAMGTQRMSSDVVRGYLMVHYPTSPACVAGWNNGANELVPPEVTDEPTAFPTPIATP